MECPVCANEWESPAPTQEEVYYDCPHCGSSLLLKKGQCEVLSQGQIPDPSEEGEKPPSSIEPLPEEEDFPDEVTKVPELKMPEEADIESDIEKESPLSKTDEISSVKEEEEAPTPEEPVPSSSESENESAEGAEPSSNNEEKDFPFQEEGPAVESSAEAENKEKEDFSEVAQFAGTSSTEQGPFVYDLILSEINSQDTKEKVLAVLKDEHLNLPLFEEASEKDLIKEGKIKIAKISPVQAYVIVLSLMGCPLKISWEQSPVEDAGSASP